MVDRVTLVVGVEAHWYVAHRGSTELARANDTAQITFHQRDLRTLHRNISPRSHSDAGVRLGERGCVIDAITAIATLAP